jgi:biofilm PGA synthesis N-glycosyltransferase PgaC
MRKRGALGGLVVILIVLGTVILVTADAVLAKYFDEDPFDEEPLVFSIGSLNFEVSTQGPPQDFLILMLIAMSIVALGSVALEFLATIRTIHPIYPELGEQLPISDTRQVIAVIPAHNEAENLPRTLPALMEQSRKPDRIVVVADNCTDETVAIARGLGAHVIETVENKDRKAGALNQALRTLTKHEHSSDLILVLDADTRLSPHFIQSALHEFDNDPDLGSVGGLFYGEPGLGVIGQLQRNEYLRYQLQIRHRRGRVFVLTGTASVFRAEALADVAAARGSLLPGRAGDFYDASAITEDNELTLALKTLGFRMISPQACAVETELMPTWSALWTQRKRWQRGALENLGTYGFTAITARYWGQQLGIAYGTVALASAYVFLLLGVLAMDTFVWYTFWIALTLVFVIERVATVWRGGWSARLIAAPLVIEIGYSFFLQANFVVSCADILGKRQKRWGHLPSAGIKDVS